MAIINEIPLSHWKVEAGLKLRQAMLINGIMYNSQPWQGIQEKDISLLEKVDDSLFRGVRVAKRLFLSGIPIFNGKISESCIWIILQ